MTRQIFCFLFFCSMLTALPVSAQPAAQPTSITDAHQQWLDEVRAQREAWQAQREAKRKAAEERLRRIAPWGATRLEELERQAESQREAARQRSEQFRKSSEARLEAQRQAMDQMRQQPAPLPYTPHGWDNSWYYRGY